jgi:hypothetical protein
VFHKRYFTVATIHGALGMAAELLGLYIVMVAGTHILPQRVCFKRWRLWMRVELMPWSAVLLTACGPTTSGISHPGRERLIFVFAGKDEP